MWHYKYLDILVLNSVQFMKLIKSRSFEHKNKETIITKGFEQKFYGLPQAFIERFK